MNFLPCCLQILVDCKTACLVSLKELLCANIQVRRVILFFLTEDTWIQHLLLQLWMDPHLSMYFMRSEMAGGQWFLKETNEAIGSCCLVHISHCSRRKLALEL